MFRPRSIGLLLAFITLLVYLPATSNEFINYDDPAYVTANPIVQHGLTLTGLKWAFVGTHVGNWHPLTWLSHMADCDLFRLNPAGPHLVNILFHSVNAGLLFALLFRLTNKLWSCAFVAALFAWHPMHVESVAWISERKDVLSTFFALLTLWSYVRYVQKRLKTGIRESKGSVVSQAIDPRHWTREYYLALFFYVLALLSKPMPVALPVVMLLLDYWPLNRFDDYKLKVASSADGERSIFNFLASIIWEKWPFFLLAAASCVITFLAQRDMAVSSLTQVPFGYRLENSLTAYAGYLIKMVWPLNLTFFYPLRPTIAWQTATESAIILSGISVIVWLERKINPWLIVGWLWFLVTLLPVIGLVQVGTQAMADRYSYFPLIGIFLAIVFSAQTLAERFSCLNRWLATVGVLILVACVVLTERQVRYWHDDGSLSSHALTVVESDVAHLNLGLVLYQQGKLPEAMHHYLMTLQFNRDSALAYNCLGKLLGDEGKLELAAIYYREAVKRKPRSTSATEVYDNFGIVLVKLGRLDEAMNEFLTAAQVDANDAEPHFLMGRLLLQQGRNDIEAMTHLHRALQLDPENFRLLVFTASVLAANENARVRDGAEASVLADRAVKLTNGQQPVALDALAMARAEIGQFDAAVQIQQQAIKLSAAADQKDDVTVMQKRLELYQKHQPWRQSFKEMSQLSTPEKLSPQ